MKCGAPLRESDTFCTTCGEAIGSTPQAQPYPQYGYPQKKSNNLLIVGILSAIWALIALILGLYLVFSAEAIVGELDSATWDILIDSGLTYDDITGVLVMIGAIIAASGALAAVTAVLSFTKRFYVVALIACIISSILGLIILVGAIGFFVAFFIYKAKNEFKSGSRTL